MCWEDFTKEFSHIIICSQVPEFNDFGDKHKKWSKKTFRDRWTKDKFSWNNIDKDFLMKNSVCTIKVSGSDQVRSGVNVVVSLMQNSRNQQRFGDWLPIGFVLVPLSGSKNQLSLTPEIMSNMKCYQKHQITESLKLTAGTYAAIPYTTQRKHESSFYFQVFQKSEDCTK
ncbi:hypothetical protein GDO81_019751 [Engystomops pustulosus]|uniref:Peptidase C2 calpain large subunit domain-containing protein n=1 Tax=Engystomops pustulosus TaxID=76066 RepID=A0AAV6YY92_ENGPU|nr:hypothetical protein GDO81_019751 [Engystomops pustulosus]